MRVRGRAKCRQGDSRITGWGAASFFGVRQVPIQLRRNREAWTQGPQPREKLGALFSGDRKPDLETAGLGNQIRSDQEHQIADRSQPPFNPARRQHRLSKPHQQVVQDTPGSERRICRVKRLQAERIQAQVLLQFFSSLIRFSLSARPAYIRVTSSAAYGTVVTNTRYV